MNIVRENLEDLTTLLKVTVGEADYNEAVDKSLRTYRRKANIPGFRPGMVPMGIINKMYRKGVVAEEAYRAASNGCFDYIEKEKLTLVGDMIPSEKQQPLDFENSTEYEFAFEVGLAPEINIPLSKKDKVKKYTIAIEDKMREGYRSNFTRRFGKLVDVDTVEKEDALNVTLDQPEMKIEEAYVGLIGMSDAARKPFLGKKVGDTMEVNVNELYPTPAQRAAILQVKEDELEGINPKFTLTITKIRRFTEPELNDEFFKMAFPEGNVKNADEFAQYIDSQISRDLSRESDFLFTLDIRRMLLERADALYKKQEELFTPEVFREVERIVLLENVDRKWVDHIDAMDDLMSGVGLRAYAQKNPVTEYKLEGSAMFDEMIDSIREDTVRTLFRVVPKKDIERKQVLTAANANRLGGAKTVKVLPMKKAPKVGPNDPCPCGSGKKYKKCCGAVTRQ